MNKNYKYLDNINFPSDIKKLSQSELKILVKELREELIDAVSETGGHLGAGLGVVELTVVLHYIFNTPNDKLICKGSILYVDFAKYFMSLYCAANRIGKKVARSV